MMQIDLSSYEPSELRLVARFCTDLADIREQRTASLLKAFPAYGVTAPDEVSEVKPADDKPAPKRTRKAKEETAPTEVPTTEPVVLTAAQAEEALFNVAAQDPKPEVAPVEEQKPVEEDPFNAEPQAPDLVKVTRDDVRVLATKLSEANKRAETLAVFNRLGYTALKQVPDEDLFRVYAALKELE